MTHRFTSVAVVLLAGPAVVPPCAAQTVRPGIEVLLADSAHLLAGRRLALLTNQTGIDRAGVSDLGRLVAAGAEVTAIFTPEHGYRGVLDEEQVGHGVDSATGKPIWSLYGNVRAPTGEMLRDVHVILVDLQDIGARPYTFISTALLTMRSARAHGVRVIILDRPNPIGGDLVQGPVLDTAFSSFVGMLPVPLRHGMTMGELARLGNDLLGIGADLTVVPAAGWRRRQWFDETGLPWVRPSPSMPDLESATHYPGTVLFEGTNLSVGRGTPVAFQVIGAPWLDARRVVQTVGAVRGVALRDTVVTPAAPPDGKYDGVPITAVMMVATDRAAYDPTGLAVALLAAIRAVHPDSLSFWPDRFDQLAGTRALRHALLRGEPWHGIVASWAPELTAFHRMRARYLLYR